MVLMTVDHASDAFNAGRYVTDAAGFYEPGSPLPAAQFLTRWITHLCAPTFVFLAGAALAASVEKRQAAGEPSAAIDRHLLARGLVLIALEPLWMTWAFFETPRRALQFVLFQVLYAIGAGLVVMIGLRRLRSSWLVGIGAAIFFGAEAAARALEAALGEPSIGRAALLTGGRFFDGRVIFAYPVLPWLAMMVTGWVFGRWLARTRDASPSTPERVMALGGAAALALFVGVRAANGYGNAGLLRNGDDPLQWLHVSKYPPSLSYAALELGLMALLLAALFRLARRPRAPRWMRPLELLGQTALFYYVLHLHVLLAGGAALGALHRYGIGAAFLGAGCAVAVLLPVCAAYLRYKRRHPDGWTRYL